MPAFAAALQKNFKLTIMDGLPQAKVDNIRGTQWLSCCPLCGCTHQILRMNEKAPYTPLCQSFPVIYKEQQAIWRKLYPEVAQYATLRLVTDKAD